MKFNYPPIHSILVVALIHLGVLAALVMAPVTSPRVVAVVRPIIQGSIVTATPVADPLPVVEPVPPAQKPTPKPAAKPIPKAATPEHAIVAPEPALPVEPSVTTEPMSAEPALTLPPSADSPELNNAAPTYPSLSRRLLEEGTVMLEISVTAGGILGSIRVKVSSGYKRLDDAALKTVKRWHFSPATRDGVAVDFTYDLPIEFSLKK